MPSRSWLFLSLLYLPATPVWSAKKQAEQAPSFQQQEWTGSQNAYEFNTEYDYVGPVSSDLGNGTHGRISEQYFSIRQSFMRRTLLAFLVQAGVEYQNTSLMAPNASLIPDRLDILHGYAAIDFRWSRKDLFHIEALPGLYTDFQDTSHSDLNAPVNIAYTRVVSERFQWVVGVSANMLRSHRWLPGGGFRYQMNDRWKLKFFLPQPNIEYKARENLHIFAGMDLRGDTYRLSDHFGDSHGNPALNNALVDYQEIRVGPGFSWNIKPLTELNVQGGYLLNRQLDYHNNGLVINSGKQAYVSVNLHMLFKFRGEEPNIPQNPKIPFKQIFNYL